MTKFENRCANCGGKFGLVFHQYWGLRFCRKACKDDFLTRMAKDNARLSEGGLDGTQKNRCAARRNKLRGYTLPRRLRKYEFCMTNISPSPYRLPCPCERRDGLVAFSRVAHMARACVARNNVA